MYVCIYVCVYTYVCLHVCMQLYYHDWLFCHFQVDKVNSFYRKEIGSLKSRVDTIEGNLMFLYTCIFFTGSEIGSKMRMFHRQILSHGFGPIHL